jgi:hypothetical protein
VLNAVTFAFTYDTGFTPENEMELRKHIDNDKTDKDTIHSYLEMYEWKMTPRKNAKRVLEIGVQRGGSLLLWEAFFPNAEIWGMDVFPEPPACLQGHDRIKVFPRVNAYDVNVVKQIQQLGITFDVIIDDGPHTLESMIFAAKYYTQLLAPGGLFVIEDIPSPDWVEAIAGVMPTKFRAFMEGYDLREQKGRWDDIMFMIDHKEEPKLPADVRGSIIPLHG